MPDPQIHPPVDIAIVGAGPAGLYAAFYAGMRRMSVLLLDSLPILGGQLTTLYPEKPIYDIAGHPMILAKDLAGRLVEQAMSAAPLVRLGEAAQTLVFDASQQYWELGTSAAAYQARAILLAAGIGAFRPKRLPIPGVEQFEGRGLFYAVPSVEPFRDRHVLIVGGGDSAIDWANLLAPVTRSQTLIHRSDHFRAHESTVREMHAGPTRVLTFHELRAIQGEGQVAGALLYDNSRETEHTVDVDAIVVSIGFTSSLGALKDWGLAIEKNTVRVDHAMMTNLPGVFAAGDLASYPGKLKLISVGFSEAAIAVNHAKQFIDPKAKLFPGHSSELLAR